MDVKYSSSQELSQPLPLVPLRDGVLFPGTVVTIPVGRKRTLALVDTLSEGDLLTLGVQRDAEVEVPNIADLLPFATLARVRKVLSSSEGTRLRVQGLQRVKVERLVGTDPYWSAEVAPVEEPLGDEEEARALAELLLERVQSRGVTISDKLQRRLAHLTPHSDAGRIADLVAAGLGLASEKEVQVLFCLDVGERLKLLHRLIAEAKAYAELRDKISRELQQDLGKSQREAILRHQLRLIQKELGEDDNDDRVEQLREQFEKMELPEEVNQAVDRELRRLGSMAPGQADYHVSLKYLELIAELPWTERAGLIDDLEAMARQLDADHYGLEKVKKRILEHLAVAQATKSTSGAILCLVGPPGVGKTSLGQSVADATGRPLVRVALGGVRDEAEIRGHRRTYVGALPGRIIHSLRKASVKNPVLLLDEVDKLGLGWMGSPEAALLEVLDPEQNNTFTDHYLELPFDLSQVFFICTANTIDQLSPPLRDRLEVIELPGYSTDEKTAIARQHLLPEVLEKHGLTEEMLCVGDDTVRAIIADYTREAGVRQLKRELTAICRAITLERAKQEETKTSTVVVSREELRTHLGRPRFFSEAAERTAIPGVATGLAWTPVGGDILFVETSRMPGQGKLEITGQLGDVMKESARAALTYLRSHAETLNLDPRFFEKEDLHVHVPAGAIPKDGPSAGVTIFTALVSLLTGRRARSDTAMTGEVTLRGRVLPVGGIKAKLLAAHRAGIRRVILPERNRQDLEEVPEAVQEELECLWVNDMTEVLEAALDNGEGHLVPAPSGPDSKSFDDGEEGAEFDVRGFQFKDVFLNS
jgi:ATP-dependent Lon protease